MLALTLPKFTLNVSGIRPGRGVDISITATKLWVGRGTWIGRGRKLLLKASLSGWEVAGIGNPGDKQMISFVYGDSFKQ